MREGCADGTSSTIHRAGDQDRGEQPPLMLALPRWLASARRRVMSCLARRICDDRTIIVGRSVRPDKCSVCWSFREDGFSDMIVLCQRSAGRWLRQSVVEHPVPKESDFVLFLEPGVQLRIRFIQHRNDVLDFLVQLEALSDGVWRAVVRYDSAHGRPHRDILDRQGREVSKEWLPGTFNDVLTAGILDLRLDWRRYIEAYREGA